MKLKEMLKCAIAERLLYELSTIQGDSGGNNSARYTAPGQSVNLSPEQLSGFIQLDFPVADAITSGGDRGMRISVGTSAKYNNKDYAERLPDGSLKIYDEGEELLVHSYDYWKQLIDKARSNSE